MDQAVQSRIFSSDTVTQESIVLLAVGKVYLKASWMYLCLSAAVAGNSHLD